MKKADSVDICKFSFMNSGDRGYMLQISLFLTSSDGYDGNGFKFLARCSPECDQMMCTISGN